MHDNLPSGHLQIARQIAALEKAVLAFQPAMVGAAGIPGASGTNLAIILSARLATVWKRVGQTIPRGATPKRAPRESTARFIARWTRNGGDPPDRTGP